MTYDYRKDYPSKVYTGYKGEQETLIVQTIMNLLNRKTYNDLEEFKAENKTYQEFLKKNNLTTAIKHFGNSLKEQDFVRILENVE